MLWGALGAAIPVAIHLFFRSRYRTVPWAAMKFLLTSVEQTSRRLKFQEYMLLLLRVALLVFLALALARPINLSGFGVFYLIFGVLLAIITATWALAPFWQATSSRLANVIIYCVTQVGLVVVCVAVVIGYFFLGAATSGVKTRGEGDSVDAVLVFDTSYSMGAQDGAKSRLDWGKQEAIKIIDELPPHSTVQIITCAGKTPTLIGPRTPGNLDQAKQLVQEIELVHLNTDLAVGVTEAKRVLAHGTASNKELYIFSDMQKSGFERQSGVLKATLDEVREKAVVHFVRCGERKIKNVAIVGITPQTGTPRPGEKASFGVLIQNTSTEPIENLNVSLFVDGEPSDERKVPKLAPTKTHAVTLRAELKTAGPRVLTAKVVHDELDGDNRYDHVVVVRKQVNILIVDGKPNEKEPVMASSFYAAHALALARHNPSVVSARLASHLSLKDKDICILVNCAVKPKLGVDGLDEDFIKALGPFVREGHGLIVFSGDNVDPAAYNSAFLKSKLLPTPLKGAIKAVDAKLGGKETEKKPFKVDRQSFASGPPAFWIFKDDERYYKEFDKVEVWQHIELNEALAKDLAAANEKKIDEIRKELAVDPDPEKLLKFEKDLAENLEKPFNVILRINNGQGLVAAKKVGAGEVIFVGTAAHDGGIDPKGNPLWTDLGTAPEFIPFMDVTVNYLLQNQSQTYNLVAGQSLRWYAADKQDHAYYLFHPGGKRSDRLGIPTKGKDGRPSVSATDLPRAGVYHLATRPRANESSAPIDPAEAIKTGTPIAVIPDLDESADLTSLSADQINAKLGYTEPGSAPIHIVAGQPAAAPSAADRLNREWTTWALLFVLGLVLVEVVFAWWCGRGW
jgi:hypothetical protein